MSILCLWSATCCWTEGHRCIEEGGYQVSSVQSRMPMSMREEEIVNSFTKLRTYVKARKGLTMAELVD